MPRKNTENVMGSADPEDWKQNEEGVWELNPEIAARQKEEIRQREKAAQEAVEEEVETPRKIATERAEIEKELDADEPFGENWRREKAKSFGLPENATTEEINRAEIAENNARIDEQRAMKGESFFDKFKNWFNGN